MVNPDGTGTPLDFNNLFLSDDGIDQWPPRGFDRQLHPRGADCSMDRQTSYYYYIPEIVGGHASVRHGVRIGYASIGKDDVDEFALGQPMIHPMTGQSGMWYPDE